MKSRYQSQLENIVSQKHVEYQEQLSKHEQQLIAESKDRERLIADRAIKQIKLINEKNCLEIKLLRQKYIEEGELYRIQLMNANKKIEQLESKLESMKTKRADIAEKLHNIMEVQWQKALEILTSPNQTISEDKTKLHCTNLDGSEASKMLYTSIEDDFKQINESHKKQNCLISQCHEGTEISPVDKLQAYIQLV